MTSIHKPSAFSTFASKYLNNEASAIFRPPSPSRDPFLTSPSASRSHLDGASTPGSPPFPGAGIDDLPDIGDFGVDELPPPRSHKGWLAHQSVFPPSSSSSSSLSSPSDSSISGDVRGGNGILLPQGNSLPSRLQIYHGHFGHWGREGIRKYKDSAFLGLWLVSVFAVMIALPFVWGATEAPVDSRPKPSMVPLLPLLFMLLVPSLLLPPLFLLLLRRTVRSVLLATSIVIPFSLFLCGWWAFAASFEVFESPDRWWGTTGLRLVALLLWLISACFGRAVWTRRSRLDRTAAVVETSTKLLLEHPPLVMLTPMLLAIFALTSLPFLTMLIRLGTIGFWRQPAQGTFVFHLRPYAGWLILLVTLIWLWTWGVIRGICRVSVAAVVSEWYFHRSGTSPLDITTAAVHRATGSSLGSICLGAGIVAILRFLGRTANATRRVSASRNWPAIHLLLGAIAGILDQVNGYALVYVGITGEPFWPSSRKAARLAERRQVGHLLDYTLIKLLLTFGSISMALFTGTAGYLYMSHSMGYPGYAPAAALLCGGVPFMAVQAGASMLGDAADALFICHRIDTGLGDNHCPEVQQAFEKTRDTGSA